MPFSEPQWAADLIYRSAGGCGPSADDMIPSLSWFSHPENRIFLETIDCFRFIFHWGEGMCMCMKSPKRPGDPPELQLLGAGEGVVAQGFNPFHL